ESIRAKSLRLVGAHVGTLDYESRLFGEDMHGQEARGFLDLLASGGLEVTDLITEAIDPREADAFYRRLATSHEIVGARFDWTRLAREERVAEGRLWRLPDLSGRGVDFQRRPLQTAGGRRGSLLEQTDPLAEATGRLRIGLFGCGDIALPNAEAISLAPNVDLVACYDPIQ